jgi:hypothetical protein
VDRIRLAVSRMAAEVYPRTPSAPAILKRGLIGTFHQVDAGYLGKNAKTSSEPDEA